MAVNNRTFLKNLRGKQFNYSDDFYRLKGKKVIPYNSFSYYLYDVMHDIVDFKTNNFSNLFLSKKMLNSDWLEALRPEQIGETETEFPNPHIHSNKKSTITMLAVSPFNYKKEETEGVEELSKIYFYNYDLNKIVIDKNIDISENDYTKTVKNKYLFFPYNSIVSSGEIPTLVDVRIHEYNADEKLIFQEQFQMNVNIIDAESCTITHNYGGTVYYLAFTSDNRWEATGSLWEISQQRMGVWSKTYKEHSVFWTNDIGAENINHIWNFKEDNGFELFARIEEDVEENPYTMDYYLCRAFTQYTLGEESMMFGNVKCYQYKPNAESDTLILSPKFVYSVKEGEELYTKELTSNALYDNPTMFTMTNRSTTTYQELSTVINSSHAKYNHSNIIGEIDTENSIFDLKTQFLLHHEYNNKNGINFFPLKNHISYQGNTILGHYEENTYSHDISPVDFRTYNSINSGFNQERGLGNISLNYTFTEQEYEVNEGEDIIFNTEPLELKEQVIPIQDCAFIDNGAFGSDTPWFADKFKMLQNDPQGIDNGTYLCTWLRKENLEDDEPQWMDRYYKPTSLNNEEALKKPAEIEQYSDTESYEKGLEQLTSYGVADFPSKVVIKDKTDYKFSRLSKEMVDEMINNLNPNIINIVRNQNDKLTNLSDGIRFDNNEWRKMDFFENETSTSFNFNTDILIDPQKRIGINIFGTGVGKGFNITNRTDVKPYTYYADNECVYIFNNKWEVSNKVNFKELYNDTILKLIQGDTFEDIVVVSPLYIYVLTFDLRVKTKVAIVNQLRSEDDLAIYNLTQSGLLGELTDKHGNPFRLLNYPYGDNTKEIDFSSETEKNVFKRVISENGKVFQLPRVMYVRTSPPSKTEMFLESNISLLLLKTNAVLFNNNIYIPYDTDIIKIIFCPDCEEDISFFTKEIRKEYPAAARFLSKDEYHMNFYTQEEDDTSIKKINSIFIDENKNIYALNFDMTFMSYDRETLFGLFKPENTTTETYTVYTQSLPKLLSDPSPESLKTPYDWTLAMATKEPQSFFVSKKSFDMFATNEEGYMAMVINKYSIQEGQRFEFRVYDKRKEVKYRTYIVGTANLISLDAYNFINEYDVEKQVFVLLVENNGTIYKIEYDCISGESSSITLPSELGLPCKYFSGTTNNDSMLRSTSKNQLTFTLNIPSHYLFNQRVQLTMPLDEFVRGWYNINVSVDLLKADFTIRINDRIYKRIYHNGDNVKYFDASSIYIDKESTRTDLSFFYPYSGITFNNFNHTYYLGTTPKDYGFKMNDVLRNGVDHDPYTCKNAELENTTFVKKALSLSEYQSMRLRDKNINRIILTLPCNRRNAVDEITRMFRYSAPNSISNNVKVIIDGHGLSDQKEIDSLTNEIYDTLAENIDATTNVNNIEFIQQ